jgi:hypothetical protein
MAVTNMLSYLLYLMLTRTGRITDNLFRDFVKEVCFTYV